MDGERVLREVQCPVIPSDSSGSTCIEMKENSSPGEWTRYKQAYHSCVQRNSGLVEAMAAQRVLVNKLSTFQSMKVSLLAAIDDRKSALDQRERELDSERQVWEQMLDRAKERENTLSEDTRSARSLCQQAELEKDSVISTCATLLSHQSVLRAQQTLLMEGRQSDKEREREIIRLKKICDKHAATIKRARSEYKSNLEFSEAERLTLDEANCELETELNDLRPQLKTRTAELEKVQRELSVASVIIRERDSAIEKLKAELQHTSEVPCSSCNESKRKLESMAAVLDRGGPGKHGELVVENLGLQRKLFECQREGEKKGRKLESLLAYIQEYKEKSTEKVSILKENLHKADGEIEELDRLVDKIREVLRSHLSLLTDCPDLFSLLKELDGN